MSKIPRPVQKAVLEGWQIHFVSSVNQSCPSISIPSQVRVFEQASGYVGEEGIPFQLSQPLASAKGQTAASIGAKVKQKTHHVAFPFSALGSHNSSQFKKKSLPFKRHRAQRVGDAHLLKGTYNLEVLYPCICVSRVSMHAPWMYVSG